MSKRVVEMIVTPERARKAVAPCQTALTEVGCAVLVEPVNFADAASDEERPFAVHVRHRLIRTSGAVLDEIATILNENEVATNYPSAGGASAHDQTIGTATRFKAQAHHGLDADEGASDGDPSRVQPGFRSGWLGQDWSNSWLLAIPPEVS